MEQVLWGEPLPEALQEPYRSAIHEVADDLKARAWGFVRDVFMPDETLALLSQEVQSWANSLETVVILGTGGSSLGGQALYQALGETDNTPRLIFLDNVDPRFFYRILRALPKARTGVVAISKSGHTLETLAQVFACWRLWQTEVEPQRCSDLFKVITEPTANPLRECAESHGFALWDHPIHTGGRFSVWSVVGAWPTLCARIPFQEVRAGARSLIKSFEDDPMHHAVTLGSLWHVYHGRSQHVMMPYHNDLVLWSSWHRQLWAESLGKQGQGSTPLCALGTVDQHSQLQLYLDGPADKAYTFVIHRADHRTEYDPVLRAQDPKGDWAYLQGRTMGHLLHAEQQATCQSLHEKSHPVREWILPRWDAFSLGALMAHSVLEVLLLAKFWNVNPFDQPAVESIKQKTKALLSSKS